MVPLAVTEPIRAEGEQVRLASEQRARQVAERALDRLSRLQRVTAALSEALTPREVASVIVEQGLAALDARLGRISLVRREAGEIELIAASGYTHISATTPIDAPLPTNEVIRTGRPLFMSSFDEVTSRFPGVGRSVDPVIPGALASAPLLVEGNVIGALTLIFAGDREFEDDDRGLLIALATQGAQALERSRLYELSLMIQEDLRRSRDQLAAILGGIAEGVTVQDADGKLVYTNEVAARMSGFSSAEEFRRDFPNVLQRFNLFDEAGRPLSGDVLPGRRLLSGLPPEEIVVQFRYGDTGEWRWSIVDSRPVRDPQGKLQLVVNIFRDVTDRKRQTDVTAFLGSASSILGSNLDVPASLQEVVELAIPRFADRCEVELLDDDGKPRRVAFADAYPEVAGQRSSIVASLQARGQTFGSIRLTTSGSRRVLTDRDRELIQDLATRAGLAIDNLRLFREAQEQAEHQASLNVALRQTVDERDQALTELQQALRTRDEFLASASHDLRNPLASIKATAQLLERRLLREAELDVERVREGLQRVDAIATRAAGLVEELLDLTRTQMGRPIELERHWADLVGVARESVEELRQTTERHTVRLETSEPDLVGLWDARRLERVLSNLIENAVKYSPEGGPIVVRVRRESDWAVIDVVDRGIGIPDGDRARIFERFQRASNVEQRIGGTGIGLASARHILESHGGTISVESQEGHGATFTLRLPISSPELAGV